MKFKTEKNHSGDLVIINRDDFPNFPDEVFNEWCKRHTECFMSDWNDYDNLEDWKFQRKSFSSKFIVENFKVRDDRWGNSVKFRELPYLSYLKKKSKKQFTVQSKKLLKSGFTSQDLAAYSDFEDSEPYKYILEQGTFPSPIIILKTESPVNDIEGYPLHSPYHLVEGHRRFGTLIGLYRNNYPMLKNVHECFILTINFRS